MTSPGTAREKGWKLNNKEALQQLLQFKRSQISPTDLGSPRRTGRGRRSRGLSQARVAQELFVSERTYALLERGEMAQPSAEFLDNVAAVLRMEEPERTALYVYALGYEPPFPMDPLAGTQVGPAWLTAVNRVKGQPCYINDVAWNVLACNDDFIRMFPQVPDTVPQLPERNLMRWMLLREEARECHLVDWERNWALKVTAQLRTAYAAHPHNKDLQQLDEEVNDDPVAGPIYRRHDVAYVHPDGDARLMRHAGISTAGLDPASFSRCCPRHEPSVLGSVTMCTAQPLGSPGSRFFFLVFVPTPPGENA